MTKYYLQRPTERPRIWKHTTDLTLYSCIHTIGGDPDGSGVVKEWGRAVKKSTSMGTWAGTVPTTVHSKIKL